MAARSYGSTGSQQHPYHRLTDRPGNDQAEFSQVAARAKEQGNLVKTNLQRLEQQAQDFGTARDGLQLRDAIQQLMRELYGQIQLFNRECMTLENIVNRTDVNQRRAAGDFRRNLDESISKFQRLSKEVERLERDNPLQPSNPFGETDDYNQSSGTAAEQSTYQQGQILSLEHDRRLVEERNEAMGLLFRDIQDLNSIARDMAVHVDEQQDTIDLIEDNVEAAANNVGDGVTNLKKAAWYQKKNRKLKIIIAIVIIVIILAILIAIVMGVCIGTPACRSNNGSK